jgi:hypothetical protein
MFNKGSEQEEGPDHVTSLLEDRVRTLAKRVEVLEKRIEALEKKDSVKEEQKEEEIPPTTINMETVNEPTTIRVDEFVQSSPTPHSSISSTKTLYLAAPSVDGSFPSVSSREQIGKSIYQLTTDDNRNGTFVILDTNDAIATAMISVSQFIKPVCKVKGSTAQYPRHIITEEEGTASMEGGVWKVVRKAIVRFE